MSKKNAFIDFLLSVLGFIMGMGGVWLYESSPKSEKLSLDDTTRSVQVRFSPKGGCADLVVNAIHDAEESIYVAAYTFHLEPMIDALLKAKERGVKVCILLDKGEYNRKWKKNNAGVLCDKMEQLKAKADYMFIYNKSAYSHDKVLIIDEKSVVTGSFNFDENAEQKNFENVMYIKNDSGLAKKYLDHWRRGFQSPYKKKIQDYDKQLRVKN